jgi:hypothetical protein
MGATYSSETLVCNKPTWCHIPEDDILYIVFVQKCNLTVLQVSGRGCLYNVRGTSSPTRGHTSPLHSNTDTADDSDDEEEEEGVAEISQQLAHDLGPIEQDNIAISEHLQVAFLFVLCKSLQIY